MTYINDQVQAHHERLKLMSQKGYRFLIFSKATNRRVTKIPAYNECALSRHRPRAARYLNSGFTCQPMRYSNL